MLRQPLTTQAGPSSPPYPPLVSAAVHYQPTVAQLTGDGAINNMKDPKTHAAVRKLLGPRFLGPQNVGRTAERMGEMAEAQTDEWLREGQISGVIAMKRYTFEVRVVALHAASGRCLGLGFGIGLHHPSHSLRAHHVDAGIEESCRLATACSAFFRSVPHLLHAVCLPGGCARCRPL